MDVCGRCGAEGFADFPCFDCGEVIEGGGQPDQSPVQSAPAADAVSVEQPSAPAAPTQRKREPVAEAAEAVPPPPVPLEEADAAAAAPSPVQIALGQAREFLSGPARSFISDQDPKVLAGAAAGVIMVLLVGILAVGSVFGGGGGADEAASEQLPFSDEASAPTVADDAPSPAPLDSRFCHNPQPSRAATVTPTGANLVATFQRIGTAPWEDRTDEVGLFDQGFYQRSGGFYGLPPVEAAAPAFVACLDTVGNSDSELRCTGYKTGEDHFIWGYHTTVSLYVATTGELVTTREYDQVANECPATVQPGSQGSVQRISRAPIIRDLTAYVLPQGKSLLHAVAARPEGASSWCDQPSRRSVSANPGGALRMLVADSSGVPLAVREMGDAQLAPTHILCVDWTAAADRAALRCDYSRSNSVTLAVGDYHVKLVSLATGVVVDAGWFPANRETCPDPRTARFGTPLRMEANDALVGWAEQALARAAAYPTAPEPPADS